MPKTKVTPPPDLKYRQVEVSGLRNGRRGKHHELVQRILCELDMLPAGSAMEIPLSDVGIGLINLRSAVHRAATSHGLKIETSADEKNFYVWQK